MINKAVQDKDFVVGELTEKEIKTVEKFHRQLSSNSILSIRTEDGLDEDQNDQENQEEIISKEEALVMQNVLRAFGYTRENIITDQEESDHTDGARRYHRLSSSESYTEYSWSSDRKYTRKNRYVSPGRFYVRISEETKTKVKEVHEKIKQRTPNPSSVHPSYSEVEMQFEAKLGSSLQWNHLHPKDVELKFTDEKSHNYASRDFDLQYERGSGFGNEVHVNGHVRDLTSHNLSDLPPIERFQELVRRAILKKEEDRKKRQEFYTRLWKKRGNVGWLDLLFTIIGLGAFFADSGTDLKVASDHFTTGHPWWGSFTLVFVFFPTVIVNVVSYFFYKEDQDRGINPENGWKAVKVTHILQVGLVERYWRILMKGYHIKFKKLQETVHYKLYIAMNLDIAMLQMILAFTEDAPQLVLQLYVLIRRHLVEKLQTTSIQDLWTIVSIFFSFISYSRAVVNYITCLRNSKKHKGVLRWYGYISMWFWRALMFTSRVLVLVFFASEFHLYFFIVLFLHFAIVLVLMRSQAVQFFPDQKGMQMFIRVVVAYIHTFCFFVLEAVHTIKWATIYYCLIAVEAIIFSSLWFTNAFREISLKLELAGLAAIFTCYVLGLLMMVVYYKFLHPKFKRPQTKWYKKAPPKEELCEEVEEMKGQENKDDDEALTEVEDEEGQNLDHLARNRASNIVRQIEVWV